MTDRHSARRPAFDLSDQDGLDKTGSRVFDLG